MMPTGNDVLRILVIDDDPDDQTLTRELLANAEHASFVYTGTGDVQTGFRQLVDNSFDVYLVDYSLGGTDGIDLVARAVAGGCVRPIIILTGSANYDLARRALRAGAADYLVKGRFDSGDLERAIRYSIERKALEMQLRQFNVELEQRVAERTADLLAANRELEGFTHSVSHDLRTPLRAIMSTSMMLLEDHLGELSTDARELLKRQAMAAKRLGQLIDDLLALSRVVRMEPVFRDVDLSAMFAQVIQERGGNPQTFIEPNMHVSGDERLLHLVGQNLVDNSIKFVRPGERAHIEIFTEGDEVVYRDQGIGFDQRYVDKIWLPFQRLVSDEAFAGTGVGLANVRRIIERHGGTIRAEGVLGEGSTFWIKLPRRAPTAA